MSDLEIWSAIVLLTLATFIARSGFWLAGARIRLPDALQGHYGMRRPVRWQRLFS
jgi:branched-subunit amino acid transport protein